MKLKRTREIEEEFEVVFPFYRIDNVHGLSFVKKVMQEKTIIYVIRLDNEIYNECRIETNNKDDIENLYFNSIEITEKEFTKYKNEFDLMYNKMF